MVESSGLENRRTGNRTVGSNPTSSATGNVPVRLLAQPSSGSLLIPIALRESGGSKIVHNAPPSGRSENHDSKVIRHPHQLKYNPHAFASGSPRVGHGEMGEWLKPAVC